MSTHLELKMARKAELIGRVASLARTQRTDIWRCFCPGSLLFCPDCGTLLDLPKDEQNEITCEQCGHIEPASCELPV